MTGQVTGNDNAYGTYGQQENNICYMV